MFTIDGRLQLTGRGGLHLINRITQMSGRYRPSIPRGTAKLHSRRYSGAELRDTRVVCILLPQGFGGAAMWTTIRPDRYRQRRVEYALLLSSALIGLTTPVIAGSGDRIGDAVTIVNTVVADFDKQQRTLATGDHVRQDEVIEVSADARGELKLDDDTKLALGPGSRLVLDKFVYDSEKRAGTIAVELAKGAFRFITGVARKRDYEIKTPNASITVRGTIFDVYILADNTVWLLLHEGAVEVTGRKSACRVLSQPGRLIRISNDGRVGRPVDWSKLDDPNAATFETAFPFVEQPPSIDPTPILTRASVINGAAGEAPVEACQNAKRPAKIQRASIGRDDDGPRTKNPPSKSQKVRQSKTNDASAKDKPVRVRADIPKAKVKPVKTAKRPRNPNDDWGDGVRGLDIVIGIGIGGGFGGKRNRGGDYNRPGGMRGQPR